MKNPFLRITIAILLGFIILFLSGVLMMTISEGANMFENFPAIQKSFTHTGMLIFSILLILLVNKGKLKDYGFKWSLKFPLFKIVLLSLVIGFLASAVNILFIKNESFDPTAGFTFFEIIIFIWFWASICEEVLTRGFIQGFLSPLKSYGINFLEYRISLPVIVGALFFGAMHLMLFTMGADGFFVINIVVFGTILGLIAGYHKEKTKSLLPAIIVHFCFNVGGSLLYIYGLL